MFLLAICLLLGVLGLGWGFYTRLRPLFMEWRSMPWWWCLNLAFVTLMTLVVWVGLTGIAVTLLIETWPGNKVSRPAPSTLPAVVVVAKIEYRMETSRAYHVPGVYQSVVPDGHEGVDHALVLVRGNSDLYIGRSSWNIAWLRVHPNYYQLLQVDSTYYLSMRSDTSGVLRYHRAEYPVSLVTSD